MTDIFSYNSTRLKLDIVKGRYYQVRLVTGRPVVLARTDTEEKARIYADGAIKGFEIGRDEK